MPSLYFSLSALLSCFQGFAWVVSVSRPDSLLKSATEFNKNQNASEISSIGYNADVIEDESQKELVPVRRLLPNSHGDEFKTWLSHPIQVYHTNWTPASAITTLVSSDLIQSWISALPASLSKKIANMYYLRATIRIKVVVQGMSFAAGQLVLSFNPLVKLVHGATSYAYGTSGIVNSKIVPHIVVDPSKTATYEIDLPICTPTGYWDLDTSLNHGSYQVHATIWNPIRSGTATSPTAAICVYMSLIDSEFMGLTLLGSELVEEKKEGGTLSNFVKNVGKYSPLASVAFPAFAPEITLFSNIAGSLGDLLGRLGFSKPPATENRHLLLNRQQDNYSQYDGTSTAIVLGGSQSTSLGISPLIGGGDTSELSLINLTAKKGMVLVDYAVPTTFSSGTSLFTVGVAPWFVYDTTLMCPTPLAGVAAPFQFWTGDIRITIEIVASVFHRATLLFAWDPKATGLSAVPAMTDAIATLRNITVNVSGNTTVEIDIPYQQPIPFLAGATMTAALTGATRQNCNGMLYGYVLNPVLTNGSTDPVVMNVYYSSDNMAFAGPAPTLIQAMKMDVTLFGSEFVPITRESFGAKTDLSMCSLRSFGDVPTSVKQVTSRLAPLHAPYANQVVALAGTSSRFTYFNVPQRHMTTDLATGLLNTFHSYYASAFLGYRGGLRWAFNVSADTDPVASVDPVVEVAHAYNTFSANTFTSAPSSGFNAGSYAFSTINSSISRNADIVAPMGQQTDFVPTRIIYSGISDSLSFYGRVDKTWTTGGKLDASAFTGSADDGSFVWFLGFPAMAH